MSSVLLQLTMLALHSLVDKPFGFVWCDRFPQFSGEAYNSFPITHF